MSALSSIEWTDRTWNPTRGCSIVSPGCVNCYAMKFAHRFSGKGKPYEGLTKQTKAGPQWTGAVRTVEESLLDPPKWRKPQRIFVNSMSDLFHGSVPFEFVDRVFAVMAFATHHTFQILTKRPDRMHHYMSLRAKSAQWWKDAARSLGLALEFQGLSLVQFPLPNVWLGVSCESQQTADERIPFLLRTPAVGRFISAEPLLGAVDFAPWLGRMDALECSSCKWVGLEGQAERVDDPADDWWFRCPHCGKECAHMPGDEAPNERNGLRWLIVGGESGPGARPCDVAWIRSTVEQCQSAALPVFVKQLGAASFSWDIAEPTGRFRTNPESGKRQLELKHPKLRDPKGGDPSEWPADLRIREFPSTEASR